MKRWVATAMLAALVGATTANAQRVQLGLRFDLATSMQWSGNDLFIEGDSLAIVKLSVGEIREVFVGPAPGVFAVWSDEGIGLLLGKDVIPGGHLVSETALVRSSRTDILWAGLTDEHDGTPVIRIVEWRADRTGRDVLRVPGTLKDFDVDERGVIAYLLADGTAALAAEAHKSIHLPLPDGIRGSSLERIFITADGQEIAVFGAGTLARFRMREKQWSLQPVDVSTQALVRHAATRRVRVEERFKRGHTQ